MQVILMEDVDRVGHEGDVIKVADGFARNYLIPKGIAVKASKGTLKDLENRRRAIEVREEEKGAKAQALADELAAKRVEVKARAGEGQRIHGQVTTQMISDAVAEQLNMTIDKRDIDIAEPIRELGDYLISAKLYKDVAAQLPVSVVRDEAADEEDENALPVADRAAAEAAATAAAEDEATEEAADETPDAADDEATDEPAEEATDEPAEEATDESDDDAADADDDEE